MIGLGSDKNLIAVFDKRLEISKNQLIGLAKLGHHQQRGVQSWHIQPPG